jgi:hypothetical protein
MPVPVAYVVKQDKDYLIAGLAHSETPIVQAVVSARAGNTLAARQWMNWGREEAARPPVSDAEFEHVIGVATGQQLLNEGKAEEAAAVLLKAHAQEATDVNATYILTESLIQSDRTSEAKTYIEAMPATDAGEIAAMRLRAHLAAQEKNFSEAVAIEKQICSKPTALALDWNDFAWMSLFVPQNGPEAEAAAEKAVQMMKSGNSAVFHTLAIAQASNGHIKDAIATGYKICVLSGDAGQMETIFGRIAEELGLSDVARGYYSEVQKDNGSELSSYSYAQMRLLALKPVSRQAAITTEDGRNITSISANMQKRLASSANF